jgi:hypothetical protein
VEYYKTRSNQAHANIIRGINKRSKPREVDTVGPERHTLFFGMELHCMIGYESQQNIIFSCLKDERLINLIQSHSKDRQHKMEMKSG